MNPNINYDFPLASPFTKEEMQQRYWKCLYTSSSEKMLHYWVALPQSLKPADIKPVDFPEVDLVNVSRYITSDDMFYFKFWVAYERCKWEMNASECLCKNIITQRRQEIYSIIALRFFIIMKIQERKFHFLKRCFH